MKKYVIFSLLGAIIYFILWMALTFPYRVFPSDDLAYRLFISDADIRSMASTIWMALTFPYRVFPSYDVIHRLFMSDADIRSVIASITNAHHPVFYISLLATKIIWSFFSSDFPSALLFHTTLSNSIIVFLLAIIVFMITKNIIAVIMSMALYATSPWPIQYSFLYFYSTFAAMLSLIALFFLLKAYLIIEKRYFFMAISGIVSGLFFWSSPSSMVMISLFFLLPIYLFHPIFRKENKNTIIIYLVSFICTVAPFAFRSSPFLIQRILGNFNEQRNPGLLKVPFLSFFYILGTYNPLLSISFFIVCILLAITMVIRNRILSKKIEVSSQDKILFSLIAIIWLHSIIIDILPFSKLSRSHFVVYPIFIVATVSMFYFFISKLSYHYRKSLYALCFFLFVLAVFINIKFCLELFHVKQYTPRYLSLYLPQTQLYILEEDSHADFISEWLGDFHIQRIKRSELDSVLIKNKKGGIIIGPTGLNSGLSVLCRCSLKDFFIEDLNTYAALKNLKKITLPYFAYFPSFSFEEETCEGLYFSGRRVDYKSASKNLTLLLWGYD